MREKTELENLELEFLAGQHAIMDCIIRQKYDEGVLILRRLTKTVEKMDKLRGL